MPPSTEQKSKNMEAVDFTGILIHLYQTALRHILEDRNFHIRLRDNLKSNNIFVFARTS
jgi:hypothetical protein